MSSEQAKPSQSAAAKRRQRKKKIEHEKDTLLQDSVKSWQAQQASETRYRQLVADSHALAHKSRGSDSNRETTFHKQRVKKLAKQGRLPHQKQSAVEFDEVKRVDCAVDAYTMDSSVEDTLKQRLQKVMNEMHIYGWSQKPTRANLGYPNVLVMRKCVGWMAFNPITEPQFVRCYHTRFDFKSVDVPSTNRLPPSIISVEISEDTRCDCIRDVKTQAFLDVGPSCKQAKAYTIDDQELKHRMAAVRQAQSMGSSVAMTLPGYDKGREARLRLAAFGPAETGDDDDDDEC